MPLILDMDPGSEGGVHADASSSASSTDTSLDWDDDLEILEQEGPPQAPQAKAKTPRARRCTTCHQAFAGEARFCPFDGDVLFAVDDWAPSADPLIGQIIDGRYEVKEVLGEGGMGTVYAVRHTTLDRRFALKVLRRDLSDAEHSARFIQEAKAAAAIGHPNIVAVSDFGELKFNGNKPVPYFVMEFLIGTPLSALLQTEKTLPPQRIGAILLQCASGLTAAHSAGVIHRDLKPENIFLTRNGDHEFVKLLDFGVAKVAGVGRLTGSGMVFGTPHYMSPEQAAGQNVDLRADIYALGVILYQCFAGKVPFEADTYMGVLTKHMFATPEPLDHVAPDASKLGAFGPIAMRCLAKSPQDRFANMAEVSAAIELALSDPSRAAAAARIPERAPVVERPSIERPSVLAAKSRKLIQRSLMLPLFLGFSVLVLVMIGGIVWIGSRSSPIDPGRSSPSPGPTADRAGPSVTAVVAPSGEVKAPPAPASVAATVTAAPSAAPATASHTAKPPTPVRGGPGPVRPAPTRGGKVKPPRGGDVVDPWAR